MRDLGIAVLVIAMTATAARAQSPDVSSWYGTKRASLGSIFGKLALGQAATSLPPAEDFGSDVELEIETTGQRLDGVVIKVYNQRQAPVQCAPLRDRLAKAWGAPIDDGWRSRWRSPALDRAATFEVSDSGCTFHVYRTVPPKQWLNTSRRSVVPLWAIGGSADQLEAALAPLQPTSQEDADTHVRTIGWQDASTGGEHVKLTAYAHHGKVTGIEVSELVGDDVLDAWQRIRAMFGAPNSTPNSDPGAGEWEWKWRAAPGIELVNTKPDGISAPIRPRLAGEGVLDEPKPEPEKAPTQPKSTYTSVTFGKP